MEILQICACSCVQCIMRVATCSKQSILIRNFCTRVGLYFMISCLLRFNNSSNSPIVIHVLEFADMEPISYV